MFFSFNYVTYRITDIMQCVMYKFLTPADGNPPGAGASGCEIGLQFVGDVYIVRVAGCHVVSCAGIGCDVAGVDVHRHFADGDDYSIPVIA